MHIKGVALPCENKRGISLRILQKFANTLKHSVSRDHNFQCHVLCFSALESRNIIRPNSNSEQQVSS